MDEFKVKVPQLKETVSQEREMSRELRAIREELYEVKNSLRFKIAQRERINTRLSLAGSSINDQRIKMDRLSDKLSDIANLYETTELGLCGKSTGGLLMPANPIGPFDPEKLLPWLFPFIAAPFLPNTVVNVVDHIISGGGAMGGRGDSPDKKGTIHTNSLNDLEDKIDSWKDTHGLNKETGQKGVYDPKTGQFTKIDPNDQDAVDAFDDEMDRQTMEASVKIFDAKTSYEAAWIGAAGVLGAADGSHLSAKAEIGKREAYAEAYAGLYQTDPNTGKMSFKPGIGAEFGGSFSLFTAEEEAQLGDSSLGAYGKLTQTVGKVGATAGLAAGFYDASGKLNPSLYAGGELEAIAGEVSGSAGVKVAGTDIGVTGSLNYGIGAHAHAGFKDGKLSLDVGATLGVGASVKLEIDVSGTVDAVCDTAKSVWNFFTGK